MTESDPEKPGHETLDAGTVGARRQEVGEVVSPDEEMSLNLPPKVPDGTPASDLGVPPSERDGTPRLAAATAGGGSGPAGPERTPGAAGTGGTAGAAVGDRTGERAAGAAEAGVTQAGGSAAANPREVGTTKESVRRDIENDRRELGDTVEALMHKTDVKGRVQETAAQMGDELRRMGSATATTATEMVGRVKEAAPHMVERVKEAAPEMVGRVKEVTPVEVKDAAGRVTTEAGRRPVATIAVVAVLALVVVRVLRRGKRR